MSVANPSVAAAWGLRLLCLLHALVLGLFAYFVPLETGWFSVLLGVLVLAHLGCAAMAHTPLRERALVALGLVSGLVFIVVAALTVHAGAYMAALYGGLGQGLWAASMAALCAFALWTLPVAIWGLCLARRRTYKVGASVALMAGVGALVSGMQQGAPKQRYAPPSAARVKAALGDWTPRPLPAWAGAGVRDPGPFVCPQLHEDTPVVVVYSMNDAGPQARCFAAADLSSLGATLQGAGIDQPFRIEWVQARGPWSGIEGAWHQDFSLRPGIDGVCLGERCLSAWQLVALNAYLSKLPIASIPDLRMGVSLPQLRSWLGADASAPAMRISSTSYAITPDGEVTQLVRQRRMDAPKDPLAAWQKARDCAQDYILRAQAPDGRYAYLQHLYSRAAIGSGYNLPRQAGTTLALCLYGQDTPQVQATIQRSLQWLLSHEQQRARWSMLWPKSYGSKAGLGSTALPLLALIQCRSRVGPGHDAAIGRLLSGILGAQRPDGGFYQYRDLESSASLPSPTRESLYAAGQAIYALASALVVQDKALVDTWPSATLIEEAALAAMDHYSRNYWSHFLANFFYIEENWHCMAAKEALLVLPHQDYQQFCLDYLRFKSKLTLQADSGAAPEFEGAQGFGNLVVPQSTPSAGQGETLAAGIHVARALDQDTRAMEQELHSILNFLWRAQLDARNCVSCVEPPRVRGGFAESMISPLVRIDYVQHALSALGSGVQLASSKGAR